MNPSCYFLGGGLVIGGRDYSHNALPACLILFGAGGTMTAMKALEKCDSGMFWD